MALAKTLVRDTSWMVASDVLGNILSFFLIISIARILGEQELGIYAYAIAFVSLYYFIFDTGASNYVTRELSRDLTKAKIYIRNLMTLKLIFCFLAFLSSTIIILFISDSLEVNFAVLFASIAMFFNYFSWTLRPVFQAYGALKFEAISKIIERLIVFFLGIIFLVFFKKNVVYIMIALVISYSVFYIIRIFFSRRFCRVEFGFDIAVMKEMFVKSLPFWFTLAFCKIYFTIDTLMLSWLIQDYSAVGVYNAAYKILDGFRFIPAIAGIVLLPVMSKLFIEDREKLQELLISSFKYMCMIVVPLTIGIFLFADRFILFLYTDNFSGSIKVLQILILAGALYFISHIFGHFLQSINYQFIYAVIFALGTIVNISLNWFLIPYYSYVGAAIATFFTEIVCFIMFYSFIIRTNFKLDIFKSTCPIIIAGIIMGGCLFFLKTCPLFFLIPFGALIYFILLFLFGGIQKQEFNLIKQVFKKNES